MTEARQAPAPLASVARVIEHAAQLTVFSVEDLRGDRRPAGCARVRFAIVWAAHRGLGASLRRIGDTLGGRDHTTILHAHRRAETLRGEHAAFRVLSDRLLAGIEERGDA